MTHRHPLDRQTWRRWYYQQHQEQLRETNLRWYHEHKDDPAFKDHRAVYMREYRRRKKA